MKVILDQYKANLETFTLLANKLEILIKEVLRNKNITFHSIVSRVKSEDRLREKILRKNQKYSDISEVTDIVGVRVITYFDEDVERTVEVLTTEFVLDEENSTNRKELIDVDRFGYLSYHLVAQLSPARIQLSEYSRYRQIKFEIQVRSILQHAWAEIEHDIGYKSKESTPRIVRRRLMRVAGLLEIADAEFCDIRRTLIEYRKTLSAHDGLGEAELDSESLGQYIKTSSLIREIDNYLSENSKYELEDQIMYPPTTVKELKQLGITTIHELTQSIENRKDLIKRFGVAWLNRKVEDEPPFSQSFNRGITLFYLQYCMVCESNDLDYVVAFLQKNYIGRSEVKTDLGRQLLQIFNISRKSCDSKQTGGR